MNPMLQRPFQSLFLLVTVISSAVLIPSPARAATPYVMSDGDYLENFSDIANWVNNFTGGQGATNWGAVAVNAAGVIPDGSKTSASTATFQTSGSSGGVQRGSLSGNAAGTIVLLSTGTTDNTTACAIDLYLDFTGRNAGTLSFDWQEINNSTGNRGATLRVYTSADGVTFTELAGTTVAVVNNVAASGTVSAITLPASLNGSPTARIRFYEHNGTGGTTGSRPKVAIDNVAVTSTGGSDTQPQIISILPATLTTNAGGTATFAVSAVGGNLSYFWYKHAGATSNLIAGATTATLTLPAVIAADATNYSAVVSNSIGQASSALVSLIVNDPAILAHPQNQIAIIGSNATFTVTAGGTGLSYQWRKDGADISGANAASYTRTAVTFADQGGYDVVVTGAYGALTSSVATLTVTLPQLATWDFNYTNVTLASPPPSIGLGLASTLGGITPVFFSGSGSTDPTSSTNAAWGSQGYPSSTANNKSAGVQFAVNTGGFKDLIVRWDERQSNTSSRYKRFQYSLDGVNFVDHLVITNFGGGIWVSHTNDLSAITGVNNNPNFAFRLVTEFEDTAIGTANANYVSASAGTQAAYDGSAGTIRYDMVAVTGNSLSAPGEQLFIGLSGDSAVLTWSNATYTLQAAPIVTGTFTNVDGATSGYSTPATQPQLYFRLTNSAAGP